MAIVYILKVIFISWVVGHAATLLLKSVISIDKVVRLNFVGNKTLNKLIGVGRCKWILAKSLVKYFNRSLRISVKKPDLNELNEIREAMTYAETVHLVGFAYVVAQTFMNLINAKHVSLSMPLVAVNVFANLYPALVQQMNKRRIDRLVQSIINRKNRH